jgi:hypothetical protein
MIAWGDNQTLAASLKLDRIQRKNKRTHLTRPAFSWKAITLVTLRLRVNWGYYASMVDSLASAN